MKFYATVPLLLVQLAAAAAAVGRTSTEESPQELRPSTKREPREGRRLRDSAQKEKGPLTEEQRAKNLEYIRRYAAAARFGHANEGTLRNESQGEANTDSLRQKVLRGENIREEVADEMRKDLAYAAGQLEGETASSHADDQFAQILEHIESYAQEARFYADESSQPLAIQPGAKAASLREALRGENLQGMLAEEFFAA